MTETDLRDSISKLLAPRFADAMRANVASRSSTWIITFPAADGDRDTTIDDGDASHCNTMTSDNHVTVIDVNDAVDVVEIDGTLASKRIVDAGGPIATDGLPSRSTKQTSLSSSASFHQRLSTQ